MSCPSIGQAPVERLAAAQRLELRIAERREPWRVPEAVPFGDAQLKPLRGGETLNWRLAD